MRVIFTSEMDAVARRLRLDEKLPLQAVADAVGVCRQTLERHAERLGIPRQGYGYRAQNGRYREYAAPVTAEQVAKIRELQPALTRGEIAELVGCTVQQVRKWGRGTGLTTGAARKLERTRAERQLAVEIEAAQQERAAPYKSGPLEW